MTDAEIQQLKSLLSKCLPGKLPEEIFISLARLSVLPAIEFVSLHAAESGIEVLLLPRPKNDPIWPNMLHTPGTILRPTDKSFQDAFDRLLKTEIGVIGSHELIYIGFSFGHGARGTGVGFEYIVKLDQLPQHGSYYQKTDLPNNFIAEQKGLINRAVKKFVDTYK